MGQMERRKQNITFYCDVLLPNDELLWVRWKATKQSVTLIVMYFVDKIVPIICWSCQK